MTTALTVRNADIDLDTLQRTAKMLVASNFFDTKGAVEVAIAQIATKILAGSESARLPASTGFTSFRGSLLSGLASWPQPSSVAAATTTGSRR